MPLPAAPEERSVPANTACDAAADYSAQMAQTKMWYPTPTAAWPVFIGPVSPLP